MWNTKHIIFFFLFVPAVMLYFTSCRSKTDKDGFIIANKQSFIIGKWSMINSEFECSIKLREKFLNSSSTVNGTQVDFHITDSSFQIISPLISRPPIPYKFEGDTLFIKYEDENPPYIVKAFTDFLSPDTLVMREFRKETDCILVSKFKRLE